MKYTVTRLAEALAVDGDWDKPAWQAVDACSLANFMGEEPSHRPPTQFKAAYDADALFVLFRVDDRHVRSTVTEPQGNVCHDSCVEFFFTPEADVSNGYFNVEVNCGGTMLFHHNVIGPPSKRLAVSDLDRIEMAHSMPAVVEPELQEPVTWTIEYRLPLDVLESYAPVVRPAPGVQWRANFYKCADKTSHPHWMTWAPVEYPRPSFHLPEFFGVLEFV